MQIHPLHLLSQAIPFSQVHRRFSASFLLALAFFPLSCPAANDWWASLRTLNDKPVALFSDQSTKATVFIVVTTDCPISNRYAPKIRRLFETFRAHNVDCWLVHADPTTSSQAILKHLDEFNLPKQVLRDPKHALIAQAHLRVTPEAALFDRHGQLAYHGRIDNCYTDFGKARRQVTSNDLADAVDALLAGRSIARTDVPAVGCPIPPLP